MSGAEALEHYPEALTKLAPLFELPTAPEKKEETVDTDYLACRDNACSAVAKMISCAGAVLPLDRVVPLFLRGLPLKCDLKEAKCVYTTLMKLFSQHSEAVHHPFYS
jgi:hypothetical protein